MAKRAPRQPSQSRSKATVEALIDAGFSEVAERGVVATTTQNIADRAGIGIGSLYEYFPNKEAIYREMFQRLVVDTVALIHALAPEVVRMDIREGIRLLNYRGSDMLRQNDGRYLKCAQQLLVAKLDVDYEPVQRALTDLVLKYMSNNPQYLQIRNLPVLLYVFIHGGLNTLIRHMNETRPVIGQDELINGLADMVGHFVERELQIINEAK